MAHLAAALAYPSAGIHVFPLAPRSKVPLISARNGGHGLHDATTNDLIIRSWWTHQYPVVTYVTPVPRPLGGGHRPLFEDVRDGIIRNSASFKSA